MSAQSLPEQPDLDQVKRQAKELLKEWKSGRSADAQALRLRDAQLAIATSPAFAAGSVSG